MVNMSNIRDILTIIEKYLNVFEKYPNINFKKDPFSGSRVRFMQLEGWSNGRTDGRDEAKRRHSQFYDRTK